MKISGQVLCWLVTALVLSTFSAGGAWAQVETLGETAGGLGSDALDFADMEAFPVYLQAQQVISLSVEVEGVLSAVNFRPQDFVSKGEVLAEVDSELVEVRIQSIRTEIAMGTVIEEAEVGLAFATDNLAIIQRLYDTEVDGSRVGSEKELKEARQRYEMAQLAARKAQKEVALLKLNLLQNEILLGKHGLQAPVDAVVIPFSSIETMADIKQLQVGETVGRGQPVMALMKVDYLRVSESRQFFELDSIRLGQRAVVYVEGAGDAAVSGTVVFKSPTIGSTGQFNIEVEFANPRLKEGEVGDGYLYRFRPGMRARVELLTDEEGVD